MGNIQRDKTVAFLVPHSDASACTAMVRFLPSQSRDEKVSLSWLESRCGRRISNDRRALNNTDLSIFKNNSHYFTNFCQCGGFFSWK